MEIAEQNEISQNLYSLLLKIGSLKNIDKDVYLFQEGMPAQYIYIINSGIIQIGKMTEEGKELTLRLCQHGSIIGELTLFSDSVPYVLNAKALKASTVLKISKTDLEKELMNNNALAIDFMKWSTDHMRVFQYKIRDLLLYGKKGALYSTLIRLTNSYGTEHPEGIKIDLSLTDSELAAFAAATRESANRTLIELREKNIVSPLESGKLLIKDLEYLRDQIGCEDCPLVICHID